MHCEPMNSVVPSRNVKDRLLNCRMTNEPMRAFQIITTFLSASLYCGILISTSTSTASPAQPAEDLAQQAFDLLDKRCGQCHGETGSNKDLMLLTRVGRNELVGKRSDVTKRLLVDIEKPVSSLLYMRITSKDAGS